MAERYKFIFNDKVVLILKLLRREVDYGLTTGTSVIVLVLFLKPKVCFWGSNAGLNCLTNKPKSEKILQFLNWILLLDSGSLMLFPFNLTILSRLFRHQYVNCYVGVPLVSLY